MKVAIVADTHMPKRAKQLPQALHKGLSDVDFIIHAGDWQTLDVYEKLRAFAPVDGVAGNVDGKEIVRQLGKSKILTFGGFHIGVVHGDGKRKTTEKRARDTFKNENVDVIIFGHSHIPLDKKVDGVRLFNPGSPTDKRRQPRFSFGVMTVSEDIKMSHVYFDEKGS